MEEWKRSDLLALDRTVLANERTFLAYIRTFASLMGGGVGLVKIFEVPYIHVLGYICMVLATVFLVIGIYRFVTINLNIKKLTHGHEGKLLSISKSEKEVK